LSNIDREINLLYSTSDVDFIPPVVVVVVVAAADNLSSIPFKQLITGE
jgi:hypothetical protein